MGATCNAYSSLQQDTYSMTFHCSQMAKIGSTMSLVAGCYYRRTPVTRTLKGQKKQLELARGWVYPAIKKKIAWSQVRLSYEGQLNLQFFMLILIECELNLSHQKFLHDYAFSWKYREMTVKCVHCLQIAVVLVLGILLICMARKTDGMTFVVSCKNQNSSYQGKFWWRAKKFSLS